MLIGYGITARGVIFDKRLLAVGEASGNWAFYVDLMIDSRELVVWREFLAIAAKMLIVRNYIMIGDDEWSEVFSVDVYISVRALMGPTQDAPVHRARINVYPCL